MPRLVLPAAALLLFNACVGDRLGGPTADTGFERPCSRLYDGPVAIEEALVACEDSELRYYVRTMGWTSGVTIFAQETAAKGVQWADQHDLTTFKFGVCQDFDMLDLELTTSVGPTEWTPNESTAFSCEVDDDGNYIHHGDPKTGGNMTYLVRAYAVDGSLASCMVFGHDPKGLLAGTYKRSLEPDRPTDLKSCVVGAYTTTGTKKTEK